MLQSGCLAEHPTKFLHHKSFASRCRHARLAGRAVASDPLSKWCPTACPHSLLQHEVLATNLDDQVLFQEKASAFPSSTKWGPHPIFWLVKGPLHAPILIHLESHIRCSNTKVLMSKAFVLLIKCPPVPSPRTNKAFTFRFTNSQHKPLSPEPVKLLSCCSTPLQSCFPHLLQPSLHVSLFFFL